MMSTCRELADRGQQVRGAQQLLGLGKWREEVEKGALGARWALHPGIEDTGRPEGAILSPEEPPIGMKMGPKGAAFGSGMFQVYPGKERHLLRKDILPESK